MIKELKGKPKILLSEILVILILAFSFCLLGISFLFRNNCSENICTILYIPCFIVLLGIFLFTLYYEKKYNHLPLNNIFLYFGIIIFITNFIAVIIEPASISLPYGAVMNISPTTKTYYILSGLSFAVLPFTFMVLVPRRVLTNHYFDFILKFVVIGTAITILLSLILDREIYGYLFKGDIDNFLGHDIKCIFYHKNVYGRILFLGIICDLLLHIKKHKWYWLLLLIPFYLVLLLTTAKATIVLTTILLLTYLIIRLVLLAKKNKDNLIITLLIVGFILIMGIIFFILFLNVNTGILYSIKQIISNLFNGAKNTFGSRTLIWEDSFKLLQPYQYIFGFGINNFPEALHLTYSLDPRLPSWENLNFIYHSHNYFIEAICSGGVINLLIYLFINFYMFYIGFKLVKRNPLLISMSMIFIFLYLLEGMVEYNGLCLNNEDIFMTIILVLPILYEFNKTNKINQKYIDDIINFEAKNNQDNFLCKLESKRIVFEKENLLKESN